LKSRWKNTSTSRSPDVAAKAGPMGNWFGGSKQVHRAVNRPIWETLNAA